MPPCLIRGEPYGARGSVAAPRNPSGNGVSFRTMAFQGRRAIASPSSTASEGHRTWGMISSIWGSSKARTSSIIEGPPFFSLAFRSLRPRDQDGYRNRETNSTSHDIHRCRTVHRAATHKNTPSSSCRRSGQFADGTRGRGPRLHARVGGRRSLGHAVGVVGPLVGLHLAAGWRRLLRRVGRGAADDAADQSGLCGPSDRRSRSDAEEQSH